MKVTTLVIVCVMFTGCASWSKSDKALLGTSLGLQVVDYMQTKEIARNSDYYEANPILGRHPSQGEVDCYFLGSALTRVVVACYLPPEWRRFWFGCWIGASGTLVVHNYQIGVRF